MRKAVPLALVLIAGAAVILWFGSRLNSWILGGLIGGLASLLLSIPISLALFSYFARQHDEQEQYRRVIYKRLRPRRPSYSLEERDTGYYNAEEYALVDDEFSASVEEYDQSSTADSGWLDEELGLADPSPRQLPPASRRTTGGRSTRRLSTPYGTQQRQTSLGSRQMSETEEEHRTRRTTASSTTPPPRRTAYPGLPGSQKNPFSSRFRSDALRTARLEAVRQNLEENDTFFEDYDNPSSSPVAPSRRGREPRTDHHLLPDSFSEDLHRPLQRRAPYTYEDDEIRQEMARYREAPPVRRSTRYLRDRNNQDEVQ